MNVVVSGDKSFIRASRDLVERSWRSLERLLPKVGQGITSLYVHLRHNLRRERYDSTFRLSIPGRLIIAAGSGKTALAAVNQSWRRLRVQLNDFKSARWLRKHWPLKQADWEGSR